MADVITQAHNLIWKDTEAWRAQLFGSDYISSGFTTISYSFLGASLPAYYNTVIPQVGYSINTAFTSAGFSLAIC